MISVETILLSVCSSWTQLREQLYKTPPKCFCCPSPVAFANVSEGWMETKRSLSICLLNFLTAPIATQPSFSNTKILLSRLHLRKHQTLHRVRSLYARHCRWSNRIKIENRDVEVKRHTKKRRLGGWIKEIPFWWFIPHDVQSPFVWINYPTPSARTMTTRVNDLLRVSFCAKWI